MSGGSMNYLSYKVEEATFHENTIARKAFRKHLNLVAECLHAIEWNDSGDGCDGEDELIRECIGHEAVLSEAITQAEEANDTLSLELDRARIIMTNMRKKNK